jgi:hypothetical protein
MKQLFLFLILIISFHVCANNPKFVAQDGEHSNYFLMKGTNLVTELSEYKLIDSPEIRSAKGDIFKIATSKLEMFGVKANNVFTVVDLINQTITTYKVPNEVKLKLIRKDGKVTDFEVILTDHATIKSPTSVTGFSIRAESPVYKTIKKENANFVKVQCKGILKDNADPNCYEFVINEQKYFLNQRGNSSYAYIRIGNEKLDFPGIVKIDPKKNQIQYYRVDNDLYFFGHHNFGDAGDSCYNFLKITKSIPSSIYLGCVGGNEI